jgi:hypothetical protein
MNINNKNLETLLTSYIGTNVKAQINGRGNKVEFYWDELLTDLVINETSRYFDIHYKYISVYRNLDFEGQVEETSEIIEFTLSSVTDDSKENLERLEKEYCIDKNCLYYIINILKEL